MNNILEMIKNEKVEWKKLGDVCEINKGKQLNRTKMIEDGKYPVINGGISPSGYYSMFNTKKETITVSQGGASAGYVNFIEKNFWLGAHAFSVIPKNETIDIYDYKYCSFNRFIYHILKMNQPYLQESQEGAGIPSVSKEKLSKIQVPLISKETQEKIVEILDSFVKYSAELQAELQNRSSQYEYFRDLVLSKDYLIKLEEKIFYERNKNIEIYKIKDLCKRQRGIKITAKEMEKLNDENSPVKVFAGGNTIAKISKERVGKENIINEPSVIVKSRGNIDFEYYDKAFTHKNEMWSYSSKNENVLNIKFLYYLLKNNLGYFINNAISGKLPQISTGVTDNYKILLPSIEIQNKVVEVLDKFQNLISDAEGLLPEEIEQRQKQYEYYREKLLTFENNMVQVKSSQVKSSSTL